MRVALTLEEITMGTEHLRHDRIDAREIARMCDQAVLQAKKKSVQQ